MQNQATKLYGGLGGGFSRGGADSSEQEVFRLTLQKMSLISNVSVQGFVEISEAVGVVSPE